MPPWFGFGWPRLAARNGQHGFVASCQRESDGPRRGQSPGPPLLTVWVKGHEKMQFITELVKTLPEALPIRIKNLGDAGSPTATNLAPTDPGPLMTPEKARLFAEGCSTELSFPRIAVNFRAFPATVQKYGDAHLRVSSMFLIQH